jgi:hypothetical protein
MKIKPEIPLSSLIYNKLVKIYARWDQFPDLGNAVDTIHPWFILSYLVFTFSFQLLYSKTQFTASYLFDSPLEFSP